MTFDKEELLKPLRDENRHMMEEIINVRHNPECVDIIDKMFMELTASPDSQEFTKIVSDTYKKLLPHIRK